MSDNILNDVQEQIKRLKADPQDTYPGWTDPANQDAVPNHAQNCKYLTMELGRIEELLTRVEEYLVEARDEAREINRQ